jgi:hypothetical protein
MDNSLFMENFIYVVVIIAAIIFSAFTQSRDGVNFSTRLKCSFGFHQGEWVTDGCAGCYQSCICTFCEITDQRVRHEGPISWWNNHCKRCGAYLGYQGGGDD